MKNLILSLCLLSATSAMPALAQDGSGASAPTTVSVERHVDVQSATPAGGWGIDGQTAMWVGGLVGVGILLGLVAMLTRGNDSVTVIHD